MRYSKLHNTVASKSHRISRGFTALEVVLVFAAIMLMLSLLVPAIRHARIAAQRTQCANNLYELGIALQNYQHMMGVLPPGCVNPSGPIVNQPVGYHVGWQFQLLPFMDQSNVYESTNMSQGVYGSIGAFAYSVPGGTVCPADPDVTRVMNATTYAGSIGSSENIAADNNGLLYLNSSISDRDIADGLSHTLMVAECRAGRLLSASGLSWASGTAASLRSTGVPLNSTDDSDYEVVTSLAGGFGSWHEGTVNALLADGSLRLLSESIDPQLLRDLGNRNDGNMMPFSNERAERRADARHQLQQFQEGAAP